VVSSSLPGTLEELLLGLHLALRPLPGLTLGATAYGALLRLPGPLGFQRSSRWPATGLLGAAGMHGRWAAGPLVLALEVARSFEGRPGDAGGGFGAVQRAAWSQGPHQLELALRAYDPHFASLHGRPTAASDLEEGQRARNELGARLSWRWRGRQAWSAWVRVDAWANPWPREGARPAWTPGLTAQARLDVRARPWLQATAFGAGGLRAGGCDAGASDEEAPAEPCATGRWKAGLRLELSPPAPTPGLALHAWVAGASSGGPWRTDLLVQAEGRWASPPGLELRLGGRGLLRGAGQGPPVEARLTGWLECRWSPLPGVALGLRYEVWGWLAGPAPSPNPEHRGLLDLTVAW
jgi:hypothetical protein